MYFLPSLLEVHVRCVSQPGDDVLSFHFFLCQLNFFPKQGGVIKAKLARTRQPFFFHLNSQDGSQGQSAMEARFLKGQMLQQGPGGKGVAQQWTTSRSGAKLLQSPSGRRKSSHPRQLRRCTISKTPEQARQKAESEDSDPMPNKGPQLPK